MQKLHCISGAFCGRLKINSYVDNRSLVDCLQWLKIGLSVLNSMIERDKIHKVLWIDTSNDRLPLKKQDTYRKIMSYNQWRVIPEVWKPIQIYRFDNTWNASKCYLVFMKDFRFSLTMVVPLLRINNSTYCLNC